MGRKRKKKKFNQEHGSIDHTLSQQPKTVRDRYRRNKARYYSDFWALERWARDGYVSREEDNG